ncbi:MAG: hypothetical protein WBD87_09575 [Candidatus Acidiferrales bacterium]
MPDWRNEIARVLASGRFSAEERDEVARELACYLDDLYDAALSRGLDESAATEHASAELYEDARLGPKLRRARQEDNMNDRHRAVLA